MAARCIILDFDGTFTRVDDEAASFLPVYREHTGRLLGLKPGSAPEAWSALADEWSTIEREMERAPDRYGWTDAAGRIVAPAYADPYIKARAISEHMFSARGLFGAPRDRAAVLDALFWIAREAVRPVFRPEAAEAIRALVRTGARLYVVTNSGTAEVQQKLSQHLREAAGALVVCGEAMKFVVRGDGEPWEGPESVPSDMRIPGLGRPVYVQRPRYLEVLQRLWRETGAGPESTLVCGDIFELDLALPAALGASVCLITRPGTPAFEREAAARLPRGRVVSALTELVPLAA